MKKTTCGGAHIDMFSYEPLGFHEASHGFIRLHMHFAQLHKALRHLLWQHSWFYLSGGFTLLKLATYQCL